ncbi:hypothetical protein V1511DRAFT_336706 [Dipodascopsis uninucleata]
MNHIRRIARNGFQNIIDRRLSTVSPRANNRNTTRLPTYFSDGNTPEPLEGPSKIGTGNSNSSSKSTWFLNQRGVDSQSLDNINQGTNSTASATSSAALRELALIIAVSGLLYLWFDMKSLREEYDKKMSDLRSFSALTQKKIVEEAEKKIISSEQARARDLSAYNRNSTLALIHVGILRKQLIEAGIEPSSIDEALNEFQKNVEMRAVGTKNPVKNYYFVPDAELRPYTPTMNDYGRKTQSK